MQKTFSNISKILSLNFSKLSIFIFILSFIFSNNINFVNAQVGGSIGISGQDGAIGIGVSPNGNISGQVAAPVNIGGSKGTISIGFGNGGNGGNAAGAPATAGSAYSPKTSTGCNSTDANGVATFGSIGCLINNLTNNVVRMLAVLFGACALTLFLWGIVVFIKDADNDQEREKGKKFMLWGIIALFVLVSVWGIVRMFQGILGINPSQTQVILPSVCTQSDCGGSRSVSTSSPLGGSVPATKVPAAIAPAAKAVPTTTTTPSKGDQYGNSCKGGEGSARRAANGDTNGDILYCSSGLNGDPCQQGTCYAGQCNTSKDPNGTYGICENGIDNLSQIPDATNQTCSVTNWCPNGYTCSSTWSGGNCKKN